jgi:hypothetical protein
LLNFETTGNWGFALFWGFSPETLRYFGSIISNISFPWADAIPLPLLSTTATLDELLQHEIYSLNPVVPRLQGDSQSR